MFHSAATGDPQNFTINVAPQADFPIDLYILMDLTASQQDALNSVRDAIDDIGEWYDITLALWTLGPTKDILIFPVVHVLKDFFETQNKCVDNADVLIFKCQL